MATDGGPTEEDEGVVRSRDLPVPPALFEHVVNPLMERLLRSRWHGLVSDSLLLVAFTGRKSGRQYSTPVGYEQLDGTLYVTSQTDRVWWRNLRGGAPVTVRLRGERLSGTADVVEDDDAVAEYVEGYVDRHGLDAVRRLAIAIEGDGVPDTETLAAGLADVVVVRVELDGEAP